MLFQINKFITILYVWIVSKINPWRKVNQIYLPFSVDIGFNVLRWIINGKYEYQEYDIVKNKLLQNDVVLEIGTGLGFITTFCAQKIGSDSVHTFEANKNNIDIIKQVFLKNKVSPILSNAYLSEKDGYIDFSTNESNRLGSSSYIETQQKNTISTKNINQVISDIKPTYLILDIEGGEYDIFKIISFQTINKVQFELHPTLLSPSKCEEIFTILSEKGFIKDVAQSFENNLFYYK